MIPKSKSKLQLHIVSSVKRILSLCKVLHTPADMHQDGPNTPSPDPAHYFHSSASPSPISLLQFHNGALFHPDPESSVSPTHTHHTPAPIRKLTIAEVKPASRNGTPRIA
ncbi:hypothetical protein M501DRAFT_326997 [Patellaria atrata CBS 101060]|uniref:Uncharacterized protein n=1 Tax=Patellaria atrata CBS 101060 TaxID=1346257 RepID=A0A9P4S410_9PEZI|nr:hypothetical protein M501DRAFT_326997 [Patellaria atrata CBS 101060]